MNWLVQALGTLGSTVRGPHEYQIPEDNRGKTGIFVENGHEREHISDSVHWTGWVCLHTRAERS